MLKFRITRGRETDWDHPAPRSWSLPLTSYLVEVASPVPGGLDVVVESRRAFVPVRCNRHERIICRDKGMPGAVVEIIFTHCPVASPAGRAFGHA